MENTPLRRKDTMKGPPLRVLSLDGGGVRGYSMLIILQELMHRTYVECEGKPPKRDQIPKPCDHFDLIAGTGTGGLIALMLGRLRLDIETCKDVYVRMTRRVFETDKTIAGIPYRSTLFKASKLEDAIRQCVGEHTVDELEGNDGSLPLEGPYLRHSLMQSPSSSTVNMQRRTSRASVSTYGPSSTASPTSRRSSVMSRPSWGNSNAKLYDNRENRTKTAVTALYKGTPKNGPAILLRSYDSRKEPPPEFNCTIWQAGRATSATGLAFKPIQIGQHLFIDEGPGKYNPSPQVLDEAVVNEWPGRELGVFVSIGTGKRPAGTGHLQHEWWEDFFADSLGNFAEARRRLISKIEGCEATHQHMLREHLAKRNVPKENYYRLNVEVGVGEFGMNEWSRLAEISTNTRMHLAKQDVQRMNYETSAKLAKIERMHRRLRAHSIAQSSPSPTGVLTEEAEPVEQARPVPPIPRPVPPVPTSIQQTPTSPPPPIPPPPPPEQSPGPPIFELPAIELPADNNNAAYQIKHRYMPSADDKYPVTSDDHPQPLRVRRRSSPHGSRNSRATDISSSPPPPRNSSDRVSHSNASQLDSPRASSDILRPDFPPPVPPKTPIPYPDDDAVGGVRDSDNSPVVAMPIPPRSANRPLTSGGGNGYSSKFKLPYPDDGPPPSVNRSRKPTYNSR